MRERLIAASISSESISLGIAFKMLWAGTQQAFAGSAKLSNGQSSSNLIVNRTINSELHLSGNVIVLCTRTNNIWYPRLIAWMVFADVAEISDLLVSLGSARC
jgi:hypothetical protein